MVKESFLKPVPSFEKGLQTFNHRNGKRALDAPWLKGGERPAPDLARLKRSTLSVQKELARTMSEFGTRKINDQRRFDQTEKPRYPNFEPEQKGMVLSNVGWGLQRPVLKYKTAFPQKGLSQDRHHLKYFDTTKPSKFAGHPAGFNEGKPDKVLIDMHPEVYNINFPPESRMPLNSLDFSRQSNNFQQTQSYLH